jgi:DNA-binding transcriptional MocR family regulator
MSGGCPSQFNACALTPLISDGTLNTRIVQLKEVYSRRAKAYATAMEEYWVPHGVQYTQCLGGYFIWVMLPPEVTATELSRLALENGVWIMEGTSCMVPDDESVDYKRFIRICVALEESDNAVEGIKRIGKIIEKLRQK